MRALKQRAIGPWTGVGLVAALCTGTPAWAGDLDFQLNASKNGQGILFDSCGAGCYQANEAAFRDFTTQLGFVLAPRMASPAETLGHAGFSVGAMWSGSFVSSDQNYWNVTNRGQSPAGAKAMLQTLQLDVRKGLPFSFEVGANFMWLADSELFAPGLEVRWALQEGHPYVPDLAVRGAVNHMVGNRDLLLTTVAVDGVLSKGFGLGGTVNLAPYVGWSLVMIAATSRVIDPTPLDEDDLAGNLVFQERKATAKVGHKLTAGLRLLYSVLNVSVQGEFQMLPDYETGGSGVTTITTKLGLDF
ncbi:MAG: hypothetical protein KC933_11210 [Myxococcales bacterium]|nr:hypothetical protein [Myxococcales bacterium]